MRGIRTPIRIAIGMGIGVGIGIGVGVGSSFGSQGKPQVLVMACPASSHTVESDVLSSARIPATLAESIGGWGACCAASPGAASTRKTAGQRDIATSTERESPGVLRGARE